MAERRSEQRGYPLPAYNFRVSVGEEAMRFAKVSGLVQEHQALSYRHGLSFLEGEQLTLHHFDKYEDLTLEQGTVHGSSSLYDWFRSRDQRSIQIRLCDPSGAPVVRWHIAKAQPIKLSGPQLDALTNEVSIDTLEIKAAGIRIDHVEQD